MYLVTAVKEPKPHKATGLIQSAAGNTEPWQQAPKHRGGGRASDPPLPCRSYAGQPPPRRDPAPRPSASGTAGTPTARSLRQTLPILAQRISPVRHGIKAGRRRKADRWLSSEKVGPGPSAEHRQSCASETSPDESHQQLAAGEQGGNQDAR